MAMPILPQSNSEQHRMDAQHELLRVQEQNTQQCIAAMNELMEGTVDQMAQLSDQRDNAAITNSELELIASTILEIRQSITTISQQLRNIKRSYRALAELLSKSQ